jgi:HEAT repeat protein
MGLDAVEATPALRSALTDEDVNVRDAARRAIDQIEGRL